MLIFLLQLKMYSLFNHFTESWKSDDPLIGFGSIKTAEFVCRKLLVLDWSWCNGWIHNFVQHSIYNLLGLP